MRGLETLKEVWSFTRPLAGNAVLINMHLTRETLNLADTLKYAGARIIFLPSNKYEPDPVVSSNATKLGAVIRSTDSLNEFSKNYDESYLVIEGNGKIFNEIHNESNPLCIASNIKGISMHTSGGGRIVDSFDHSKIRVPVVAVYKDPLKTDIETGVGTSLTVAASLLRGLSRPIAGRKIAVVGFGNVGRGIALKLRSLGARVTIVEKKASVSLNAELEGFNLDTLQEALTQAELCITTTGTKKVINQSALANAREGILLANVSNQPEEIDVSGCKVIQDAGSSLKYWRTASGRNFGILGDRLQVNHIVGSGNPKELMDISFTIHCLIMDWLVSKKIAVKLHSVPEDIREHAAKLTMRSQP